MADIPSNLTPAQMLEEVNKAIYTVLIGGQSYRIGNRQLTRADLSMLKTLRSELEAQTAASSSGDLLDGAYVAIFEGR